MEVCEADNEVARIKEELEVLPKEMSAHLSHYCKLAAHLQHLQVALAAEPTAQQLHDAGYTMLQGTGRYQPSSEAVAASAHVRSGTLTFVSLAEWEVQQQLAKARSAFRQAGLAALVDDCAADQGSEQGGSDAGVGGTAESSRDEDDEQDAGTEDSEDGDMAAPSDDEDVEF
jgi:hypothetical protein